MMTQVSSSIGQAGRLTFRPLMGVLIVLTCGLFSTLFAQPRAGSATAAVKETVDQVLAVLDDESLNAPEHAVERLRLLEDIVAQSFDYEEMGKRTLGAHWRKLNATQQQEFVQLFQQFLSSTYAGNIDTYVGGRVDYIKERRKGDFAEVQTNVITKKLAVPLAYRLLKSSNAWRVYDVVIDGVSLVKNYRGQFGRIIKTNSFERLLEKLRSKIAKSQP